MRTLVSHLSNEIFTLFFFGGFFGNDRDNPELESSSKQVGDGEFCTGDCMFMSSSAVGILERWISPAYRFDSMTSKNIYLAIKS